MNNNLKTWHFGKNNDELIELVINAKKTATASIYNGRVNDIGTESILVYDNEKKACITKIVKNIICQFKDVKWSIVKLEGEANSFDKWKSEHYKYFKSIDQNFTIDTMILIEVFEVVKDLKKERLEIGSLIVENNLDIFEKLNKIEEINAGFNNTIFNVNDKYIIKVCDNSEKDNSFDIESNFYKENKNSNLIPNLYRYDKSKKIVPYVYEIMEKVNGKSIYYYWYKWKEFERENFIKNLMNLLSNIHVVKNVKDNWCEIIKDEIIDNYNKCKDLFSDDENEIISKAFGFYDIILSDNHYSLIHNDLHFDNILLDENNNIKLIDFNDSIIAPFDYDLRILFMCKDRPWKWANIEMDPYQKPEDYKNIRNYILKYYDKLSKIKYLNERMYIYEILSDIRHLPKYKLKEQIDNIVDKSKRILDANNKQWLV